MIDKVRIAMFCFRNPEPIGAARRNGIQESAVYWQLYDTVCCSWLATSFTAIVKFDSSLYHLDSLVIWKGAQLTGR